MKQRVSNNCSLFSQKASVIEAWQGAKYAYLRTISYKYAVGKIYASFIEWYSETNAFSKRSILDVRQGSEYASILHCKCVQTSWTQAFSCFFCEIFKNPFFEEHLNRHVAVTSARWRALQQY